MRATIVWLAALSLGTTALAESNERKALVYSAASIVNAASNLPGPIAPSTFVTIYGTGLANTTRAISAEDLNGGSLPTVLPGTGLRVLINGVPANIYYVSPTQINLMVPSTLLPGVAEIQVVLDGRAGPSAFLPVNLASPALFLAEGLAIVTHADGKLISADSPAEPGQDVVWYATGLGPVVPPPGYSQIPKEARQLADLASFRVLIDGEDLEPSRIAYAGVVPRYAGLYQVNIKLPDSIGPNPEIRIRASGQTSPPGVKMAARTAQPKPAEPRSSK